MKPARLPGLLAALALTATGAATADCPQPEKIADGVHVVYGSGGAPAPENAGNVANTVFLLGPTGAVVIDPGSGRRRGEALLCAVARISDQPVVAVIDTHPHPENVLGNIAFADGVKIYASRATATTMRERCTRCIERLRQSIGTAAMADTVARLPDAVVDTTTEIEAGGRRLRLIPLGAGHSPGDLAILDHASSTLISGDVGSISELPDLRDGSLTGSITALKTLSAIAARRILPGRGPVFEPPQLQPALAYLEALGAAARAAAATGDFLVRMPDEASHAGRFGRFAELHPLNLQHAYREAEAEWWAAGRN